MKKKASSKVSLGDVARAANLSRTAVAFALQNRPGVSAATRQRVLRIVKRLGYSPDARIAEWMARVRETKTKDLLPIAWLNTTAEKDAWQRYKFLSPSLEGARERCQQLGYRLEEIWTQQPGLTTRRLSQILYQRGIEGVIVTSPVRHLRLNWDHLASIEIGSALLAPRLHRVCSDLDFNLLLAVRSLRRLGYRRIGVCLTDHFDRLAHHTIRTTVYYLHATTPPPERIKPLFHPIEMTLGSDKAAQIAGWLKRYRPEVIIGHDSNLIQWVQEAGFRVPQDIGVVHLAIDDDVLDWAGIHSHRREAGVTAAEWLIAMVRNHQFGVPGTALNILLRGTWSSGRTLSLPKTK